MSMKVRYYWTVPLREALAVSVEKREKLWKKFPCVSHDAELRAKLWAEVADELNEQFGVIVDTEDMKKTWKNLKDNYWRMMKTSENDPERVKRWRFFNLMKFMERANIDDSSSANDDRLELPNESSPLIPLAKNENVSAAQAGNENQELSRPGKKVRRSRKARTKKIKKSEPLPTSTARPRDLIQVCIPEIDSVIQTKQRPQIGAQIYSVAVDDVDDILTKELSEIWDEDVLQEDIILAEPVNQRIRSSVIVRPNKNDNWMSPKSEETRVVIRKEAVPSSTLESVDTLMYNAQNVNNISYEIRLPISNYAAKLRGIYHQAAFSLFLKENMPSGQLHTLLDAFDDFVYNKKPKASIISKVVGTCDENIQLGFKALFRIVQRNRNCLNLRCPVDRWARLDSESRRNIDHLFGRKKRKYDIAELGATEYHRIMNKRALLAQRIENYSSIIQSTKTLLGKVEQDDNERREDLEDTIRRAQEVCERTRTEQQRLEVEYKEFQNRSYVPQRRRRRKIETKQEENFDNWSHYKTTFSQAVSAHTVTELFDNYVKSEPSY